MFICKMTSARHNYDRQPLPLLTLMKKCFVLKQQVLHCIRISN